MARHTRLSQRLFSWPIRLVLVLAMSLSVEAQDQVAIKGGKIITVSGKPITNGVILISEGRIQAVGKDVKIPVGAKVIDASDKTVMPGFVEAHSSAAMSQSNEVNPNVPFVSVVDTIDPSRTYFENARRNGVTTVAVVPGNTTMIGGQAAIVKTAGRFVDDMILKRNAGIKLSLSPTRNSSRMSHYSKLRTELNKARKYVDDQKSPKTKTSSAGAQSSGSAQSAQMEAMASLIRGEVLAFIYCSTAMDAVQALKLVDEYKLKPILVLNRNCYKAVDIIAEKKVPVVLDSTLVFWETDPRSGLDKKIVLPKVFGKKEIPVTYQVSSATTSTLGSSYFWYQAATAVKYGTPVPEAIQSLTLQPATMLGIDEFVGSIEPNKDADLVILNGDPLKVSTWVETTIVRGKVVYERSKDSKLRRLLTEPPQ